MRLMRDSNPLESAILDIVYQRREPQANGLISEKGLALLPVLEKYLSSDLPIEVLERFERIFKSVLQTTLKGKISGEDARKVAQFQKSIGFLLKYKPYAIKCSSPLGYSIFIQTAGEGFSFQQHLSHKIEVFHILEVQRGGYVFICDFEEWRQFYRSDSFAAWLSGCRNEHFDRYRFNPVPGDVFMIDRLGLVHSVMGCTLEEFATVSTDMVDRLHDQNAGRPIPQHFNRRYAEERLRATCFPSRARLIETRPEGQRAVELPFIEIPGGCVVRLAAAEIQASRYVVEAAKTTEIQKDDRCAVSVYVAKGIGRIVIGEREEVQRFSPPSIEVSCGELVMIPAGVWYGFVNDGPDPLVLTEHKIPFDVAFV